MAFVHLDKVLDRRRHVAHLQVAAPAQLMGHVLGDILRPALGGVEGDHPDGAGILAGQKVGNDGLKVGCLGVGFTVFMSELAIRARKATR